MKTSSFKYSTEFYPNVKLIFPMFSLVSTTLEGNCYLLRYFSESFCLFYATFNQETRYYNSISDSRSVAGSLDISELCSLRRPYLSICFSSWLWTSPYDTPRTVGQFPDQS